MLLYFTDVNTNRSVAVNPAFVAVVYETKLNEESETLITVINTTTGNIPVDLPMVEVVGKLNGELK
jgi:hypothetical protein